MSSPIFSTAEALPRGPHGLTREQVAESQRGRLMAAFTELLGERGYAAVTIGDLAKGAGVSRGAFYAQFEDKEACLLAAYGHFAGRLVSEMVGELDESTPWEDFIDGALEGYLGTLEGDRTAARAFIIEMDGAGPAARRERNQAVHGFAALIAQRHAAIRAGDARFGPLPDRVYLGLALGIRELVREALEGGDEIPLTDLKPDMVLWVTAMVEGAAAAASR